MPLDRFGPAHQSISDGRRARVPFRSVSKADQPTLITDVRFSPNSGHRRSGSADPFAGALTGFGTGTTMITSGTGVPGAEVDRQARAPLYKGRSFYVSVPLFGRYLWRGRGFPVLI